jgi:hypothetical protein
LLYIVVARQGGRPRGSPSTLPAATLGYFTNRRAASNSSRDIFSLRQCKRERRAPPRGRSHPAVLRQHKLNRDMVLAEDSSNLMQRLSRLPAAPHVVPLHIGQLYPSALRHKHHLIGNDLYQMVLHRPVELAPFLRTWVIGTKRIIERAGWFVTEEHFEPLCYYARIGPPRVFHHSKS